VAVNLPRYPAAAPIRLARRPGRVAPGGCRSGI